jgi:hypothetical protein
MAFENVFTKLNLDPKTLTERNVLFISGAGISAASPTRFALGDELHRLILNAFSNLNPDQLDIYLGKGLQLEETCQFIIDYFESINQDLETGQNIGWHILSELFSFNNFSTRNDYHFYFRNHLINGGFHITANIDQLIETNFLETSRYFDTITTQIIEEENFSIIDDNYSRGVLYKFHGDINSDPVGAQGFLQNIIANGFSNKTKSFWKEIIKNTKLVIFIGYGGCDEFDVELLFEGFRNKEFTNTKAIWLGYGQDSEVEIQTGNKVSNLYLSPFSSKVSIKCSPEVILNQLFGGRYKIIGAHRTPNKVNTRIKKFLEINVCKLIDDNDIINLSKTFLDKL